MSCACEESLSRDKLTSTSTSRLKEVPQATKCVSSSSKASATGYQLPSFPPPRSAATVTMLDDDPESDKECILSTRSSHSLHSPAFSNPIVSYCILFPFPIT